MQHKEEDRTGCIVSAAKSLVTLLVTVRRKFATTIRNQAISSKTVGYDLRITTLKLFKLLSRTQLLRLPLTMELHDVHEYDGTQFIQIVDGSTLPITVVGSGVGNGDREGA
ncbi:hypothetical protein OIU76_023280 [Salix suchowensis]|uniref:Uncharacterized protein n=1 Tax=Salix suchowensis TaxID=1278906 RepID=A0ABQ9ALD1_9ROSI|nr:hypothetical protein OIU76_023280 [Salix suchowensis]KAJ6297017.1 hypothetical protein OIU78_022694 [Salix suchowensis]KAJ6348540.1 hypothetical protein OIU77_006169 [Salix suchowensis]